MESEELVSVLEAAGLSPYQAAAYVELLEFSTVSAAELAESSGVPKPRIYDVLDALEARGYAETYVTDSLHARAHSAATVTDDLRERAARLERAAEEIEARWEQPRLEGNRASIVRRSETVYERASRFIDSAEYQVHISATPGEIAQFRDRLAAAHGRGVSVRVSVHTDPDDPVPEADHEGVCLEARHRGFPAPFVVLVDQSKTCFVHHPDTFDEYGIVVDGRTHAHVFHWYFRTCLWEGWPTLYTVADSGGPVEYLDIRQCIRELGPIIEAGGVVRARVRGYDLESGEPCELEGRVSETVHAGAEGEGQTNLAGKVSLTIETPEGPRSVGGWGAMMETVEASRITVLEVTDPDGLPLETPLLDAEGE
jgi:sugar-specific transcriptional regulator TrmB